VSDVRQQIASIIATSEGSRDWSSCEKWLQIADTLIKAGVIRETDNTGDDDRFMVVARNIVNQIADEYSTLLPDNRWVSVRQNSNDHLDAFVLNLIREGKTVMDSNEWQTAITHERTRQREKGYTPEHDTQHGIDHLLMWAQEYARRGEPVKSAALIEAARELLLARSSGVADTGHNWTETEEKAYALGYNKAVANGKQASLPSHGRFVTVIDELLTAEKIFDFSLSKRIADAVIDLLEENTK
jgi:hypothetical protein